MKFLAIILLMLSTSIWASECVFQTKERLCVNLEWVEGPYLNAYSKNIVTFQDIDTKEFKTPASAVKFYGWMKMGSHEHGTRPLKTTLLKEGSFENSQIYFMGGMMGTWEFKLKVGDEDIVLFSMNT
jgi:hypothetical protein